MTELQRYMLKLYKTIILRKFDKYIYFTYISNLDNPHYTSIRIMVVNLSPLFCNLQNVYKIDYQYKELETMPADTCTENNIHMYLFVGVLD